MKTMPDYAEPTIKGDKKKCCHCGEYKPLERYYRRAASADGYRPRCKDCTVERKRERQPKPKFETSWLYR